MATQTEPAVLVRAAGVLPWRIHRGALQFALVHRPRYDDWSWPKGKLERGEEWAAAAAREAMEETGLRMRLGAVLPPSWYGLGERDGRPQLKQVRYWAATVSGGDGRLEHEIDQVVWLGVEEARATLTYRRDREQLDAAVEAHTEGLLDCWSLLIVRHARAIGRSSWDGADPDRPLNEIGLRRANRIVPLLTAYQPQHLLSSPSVRCVDTLGPYTAVSDAGLRLRNGLSEEGFADSPATALKHLRKVLERGEGTALCTHGPVLPTLLNALSEHAPAGRSRTMLTRLAKDGLDKGEVLLAQLTGHGEHAAVRHLERHRPPA